MRGTVRAIKEFARVDHLLGLQVDPETGKPYIDLFQWNYIYEILYPATLIFRLSSSKLSGTHAFQNCDYYRDGVIDIVASQSVLTLLDPYIEYMRPAGVKIHWTVLVQVGNIIDIGEIPFQDEEVSYGYGISSVRRVFISQRQLLTTIFQSMKFFTYQDS